MSFRISLYLQKAHKKQMEKKYGVVVNGETEFEFSEEEISSLDLQKMNESQFHVLKNNKSYKTEFLGGDINKKKYLIKINSNSYEVDISNELDLLIKEMGLSINAAQAVNDVKAPMPGLILDVNVKNGDEVKAGDYLLVLEAMKMENTLTAPRDGVVKKIHVEQGNTVEKNQLLVEMLEPDATAEQDIIEE